MENYNWIIAKLKTTGKTVMVRQEKAGDVCFSADNGVRYNIYELDFTQAPELPAFMKSFEKINKRYSEQQEEYQKELGKILSSMDANAIADHKAKIDEREYWRKLRGEIFKMVFDATPDDRGTMEGVLEYTKKYFDAIYAQDQEFFKDK